LGVNFRQVLVAPSHDDWVDTAAEIFVTHGRAALERSGRFLVALAGGSTPAALYDRLAQPDLDDALDWSAVTFVIGDERCVPSSDPDSNLGMARSHLLDPRGIAPDRVLGLSTGGDPREEEERAEDALAALLGGTPGDGDPPETPLDLVLLGLGANGHTASLFPGLSWAWRLEDWVVADYVEVVGAWRLTLTPLVLCSARQLLFLVEGASKADSVAAVLDGPRDMVVLPAQAMDQAPEVIWLLDEAAASARR
jgi:6-phosphogluconolactonase